MPQTPQSGNVTAKLLSQFVFIVARCDVMLARFVSLGMDGVELIERSVRWLFLHGACVDLDLGMLRQLHVLRGSKNAVLVDGMDRFHAGHRIPQSSRACKHIS